MKGALWCGRNVFLSEGFKNAYDSNAITDHDGSGGDGTVTPTADRYQREVCTFFQTHGILLALILTV